MPAPTVFCPPPGPSSEAYTAWRVVQKNGRVKPAELPAALAVCGFEPQQTDRLGPSGAPSFDLRMEEFCALYDALVASTEWPLEEAIERSFAIFSSDDDVDEVEPPSQPPYSPPYSPPHSPPHSYTGERILSYTPPNSSMAIQLPRSPARSATHSMPNSPRNTQSPRASPPHSPHGSHNGRAIVASAASVPRDSPPRSPAARAQSPPISPRPTGTPPPGSPRPGDSPPRSPAARAQSPPISPRPTGTPPPGSPRPGNTPPRSPPARAQSPPISPRPTGTPPPGSPRPGNAPPLPLSSPRARAGHALSAARLQSVLGPLSEPTLAKLTRRLGLGRGAPVRAAALAGALDHELKAAQAGGSADVQVSALLHGRRRAIQLLRAELRRAEDAAAERGAEGVSAVVAVANGLATLLHASRERAQAEMLLRVTYALQAVFLGPRALLTAKAAEALAALHAELGWLRSAAALRQDAQAAREAEAEAAAAASPRNRRGLGERAQSHAAAALARANAASGAGGSRPSSPRATSTRSAAEAAEAAEADLWAALQLALNDHGGMDAHPECLVLILLLAQRLEMPRPEPTGGGAGADDHAKLERQKQAASLRARYAESNGVVSDNAPLCATLDALDRAVHEEADERAAKYLAYYRRCMDDLDSQQQRQRALLGAS